MSVVNTNSNIPASGEVRPAAPTTAPAPQKKSITDHASKAASSAWSGLTGMFSSKPTTPPAATVGGKRKRSKARSMKGGNPKKGMKSKTRKGKKDFVTHKGNKYYNRKGKRQTKNIKGKKGKPYSRRNRK